MQYDFLYLDTFISDIEALSKSNREAVLKKVEKIKENPLHFDFLHRSKRAQKARVGRLRIIFRVEGEILKFYRVGERDIVYKEIRGLF